MNLMPIEHVDDWEKRLARVDAFWHGEIIDRPVVVSGIGRKDPPRPWPKPKQWANNRDRWFDAEHAAQCALAGATSYEPLGDGLPAAWPNLGPEILSTFFGCELEFGEWTSWSVPNLKDWSDVDKIQFSKDNVYWKKLEEITDAMLTVGRNKFYVGMTDWHPGGDLIASFRDPLNLNYDMIDHVDEVKALIGRVTEVYLQVYDYWYNKLTAAGQAITSWPGIVSSKKWYVPSNDFSCMVSKKMFDDVFLPSIAAECKFLDASVYHLDGPQALQHPDSLLSIKELCAIQWVPGSGNEGKDWMHVYKKVQAAGKGLQLGTGVDGLDYFIENLRPEGVHLGLGGIQSREHFDEIIKTKISKWT